MHKKTAADFFDKKASETYDERARRTGSIVDNLHFLIRLVLQDIPTDAKILCVGVGTGTEIIELAKAFPNWRFKGLDPSASMLEVCRERLQNQNLISKCELVHGYLSDLQDNEDFDAILCLLVAHFIKNSEDRQDLFNGMAKRLKPKGYLIHAEISYDLSSPQFQDIIEKWRAMHKFSGASDEQLAVMPTILRETLGVVPPESVEAVLRKSGFAMPIQFFQSLLIRAWYSQKNP